MRPMARPSSRLVTPRTSDDPSSADTVVKASTMSAKYSAGPKSSASLTKRGARKVSSNVPMVPATNDPIAAVARAAAPRPRRAMTLPSTAVMIEPDSPGVFSRIDVVELPYMAP